MTVETSVFDRPVVIPDDFARLALERSWPDGLLRRACELRVDRGQLAFGLTHEFVGIRDVEKQLGFREQLMFGTMHVREATWQDDGAVADLYADSPEDIGEWEVTVERSPYPFAQFRLQEHVNIQVLEDRGILLAIAAHSGRNTIVEGKQKHTAFTRRNI